MTFNIRANLALFAGLISLHFTCFADETNNVTLSKPKALPAFTLSDQNGEAFTLEKLKGKWSLIFIGFTTCPDVCPYTLANLEAVRADLSFRVRPDNIPNIIFLAVDPDRDTPVLKEYLRYFHPDYIGITGAPAEIDKLIAGLEAFYKLKKKTPADKSYTVVHSAAVVVLNPQAEIVARISPPFKPHSTGEYLIQLIHAYNKNQIADAK